MGISTLVAHRGRLAALRRPREEAEAGGGKAGAAQVAGGVEATLALSGLGEGIGGVTHGGVGLAGVGLAPELGVREDLPLAVSLAVCYRAGGCLKSTNIENSKY